MHGCHNLHSHSTLERHPRPFPFRTAPRDPACLHRSLRIRTHRCGRWAPTFVRGSRADEASASEVRRMLTFPLEVRLQAELWKESGLLLYPPGLSRRAARTWERSLLLYLFATDDNDRLTKEVLARASRLFPAGWERAERGRGLKRLCAVLGGGNPAQICLSVESALRRARGAA